MSGQRPLPGIDAGVPANGNSVDGGSAHQCDAISLGHGHGDTVDIIGLQLVRALRTNLCKCPQVLLHEICCAIEGRRVRKHVRVDCVLSKLLGVPKTTVRRWVAKFDVLKNHSTLGKKVRKSSGTPRKRSSVDGNYMSETIIELHECDLPQTPTCADSTHPSDSDDYGLEPTFDEDASDDEDRSSRFSQWQKHPLYPIGIRMAELATMFYANGWAQSMFPQFLAWARTRLPQLPFGNLNHST